MLKRLSSLFQLYAYVVRPLPSPLPTSNNAVMIRLNTRQSLQKESAAGGISLGSLSSRSHGLSSQVQNMDPRVIEIKVDASVRSLHDEPKVSKVINFIG